ncbi:MAG: ABC transporter permease, partial [Mollicutes bacterium PWAP]|nr:ABC transporter permease [Mollicutes bacterium PWAP]
EYNIIMFSVILFTTLNLIINLILDILYTIIDPRIKLAEKNNVSFIVKMKKRKQRKENILSERSK